MVEIRNFTKKKYLERLVKEFISLVLDKEGKGGAYVSVALSGKDRMCKLNEKYRGKRGATDVLSFPEIDNKGLKASIGKDAEFLGEIIICPDFVEKNSKDYAVDFFEEIARVSIHGALHLLGYEHESKPEDAELMFKKQEFYLKNISKKYQRAVQGAN